MPGYVISEDLSVDPPQTLILKSLMNTRNQDVPSLRKEITRIWCIVLRSASRFGTRVHSAQYKIDTLSCLFEELFANDTILRNAV